MTLAKVISSILSDTASVGPFQPTTIGTSRGPITNLRAAGAIQCSGAARYETISTLRHLTFQAPLLNIPLRTIARGSARATRHYSGPHWSITSTGASRGRALAI